jgi:plastocyanin
MTKAVWSGAAAALIVAATVAACGGGGGGSTPTSPTTGGGGTTTGGGGTTTGGGNSTTATITIGADGRVSPSSVTIAPGGRVTMVNNHNRAHDMSSNPHPEHTQCPEINQIGFLNPGQSRTSGNFNTARSCGFHDHNEDTNTALQGTIIIQ